MSQSQPSSELVPYSRNVDEGGDKDKDEILRRFRRWREQREREQWWLVVAGERGVGVVDVSPRARGRYWDEGRRRLCRRLRGRLANGQTCGILLTLTFDPSRVGLVEAWEMVGRERRRFMAALNRARERAGVRRRLAYSAHVEAHRSGYPHVHVWFPGLRWLWNVREIERLWGWGWTHVTRTRGSVVGYVTRYVTRVKHWPEVALALMWWFGVRLYSISRRYRQSPGEGASVVVWWLLRDFVAAVELALRFAFASPGGLVLDSS